MIKYTTGNFHNIGWDLMQKLEKLTLGTKGVMLEPIILHKPRQFVMATDDTTDPVGWAVFVEGVQVRKGG